MVGKQGRGDPAKPPAEGKHTIKDSVFPINFHLSDVGLGKEQSYTIIYSCIYSLAPSSLGWALIQSKGEGENNWFWQNLCCPWRAEAALRDQTVRTGGNPSNDASGFQDKVGRCFLVPKSETCPGLQEMSAK